MHYKRTTLLAIAAITLAACGCTRPFAEHRARVIAEIEAGLQAQGSDLRSPNLPLETLIGRPRLDVWAVLGAPIRLYSTTTSDGIVETWVYPRQTYLTFDDERLTIVDRRHR